MLKLILHLFQENKSYGIKTICIHLPTSRRCTSHYHVGTVGLPEHIFIPFWFHFHVVIKKMHALTVSHLTVTLRVISKNRRSFSSFSAVHVMYDYFFQRYVTPWITNSGVMLLTGWLPPFFRNFCNQNSNFRLLDLSASEHWSPVRICGCYSSFAELLSGEKQSKHVF